MKTLFVTACILVGMAVYCAGLCMSVRKIVSQIPAKPRVVDVVSGDTVIVLMDSKNVRIRLTRIDAPEPKQPFFAQSKNTLSELVLGKDVTITKSDVLLNGKSVSLQMVRNGLAWHDLNDEDGDLENAETEARDKKIGLWSGDYYIAPWDWPKPKQNPLQ